MSNQVTLEMNAVKQALDRASKYEMLVEVVHATMQSLIASKGEITIEQALADGLAEWDC